MQNLSHGRPYQMYKPSCNTSNYQYTSHKAQPMACVTTNLPQ
jgi:hypothetical protein